MSNEKHECKTSYNSIEFSSEIEKGLGKRWWLRFYEYGSFKYGVVISHCPFCGVELK